MPIVHAIAICSNDSSVGLQLQLLGCLSGVEMVLKDVGYPVKLGSGVAAAAAYLSNSTPLIPIQDLNFARDSQRRPAGRKEQKETCSSASAVWANRPHSVTLGYTLSACKV